jgi:hypothetical protein
MAETADEPISADDLDRVVAFVDVLGFRPIRGDERVRFARTVNPPQRI